MADWTDGPEHAPVERPMGFATPRTAELVHAAAPVDLAAGRPAVAPQAYQPPLDAAPLKALVPSAGPERDARLPFDVADRPLETSWGAVHSSGHSWEPTQPLAQVATTEFDAPSGPPVAAPVPPIGPLPGALPADLQIATHPGWGPDRRVKTLDAMFWATIGCLLLSHLLQPMSFALFFVASCFPARPERHRTMIRSCFAVGYVAIVMAWLADAAMITNDPVTGSIVRSACTLVLVVMGAAAWAERSSKR